MRAALYTRLSVADDQSTYERQRDEAEAMIAAKGWTYNRETDWFTDYGRSAWDPTVRREAFEQMLDQIDDGTYQVLVAWKVDRLCRAHRDLSRVTDLLDARDASLVLITEGLDASTPMGRFGLEILTSAASLESANTSMRVASAQQHMVAAGRNRGGPIPYGWQPVPHPTGPGTWLQLHPERAEIVREMADRVLAGESPRSIAHDLNRRKIPTRKGGRWTSETVHGILRSPRMVGWQPYTPKGAPAGQVARDGDGNPIPAADPMVDLATWQRLLEVLAPATRQTARSDAAWLTGVTRCGLCGSSMATNGPPTKPQASYICTARRAGGPSVHEAPVMISRTLLEAAVDGAVAVTLSSSDLPVPVEVDDRVLAEREAVRARLDLLDDQWADGTLDDRRHARLTARLQAQLDELDGQVVGRRAPVEREMLARLDVETWGAMEAAERRRVVGMIVDRVEVQPHRRGGRTVPERVTIRWADGKVSRLDL